jgi:2',3'-cyclic-nucleotide 2'-phosphodiesterase (5'-nucleotidase family)
MLIAGISLAVLSSCSTVNESTSYDYKNLSINVIADSISDPEFERILQPYKLEVESKMSEVIAYSDQGLVSYRPESPLSNFLSDLILDFAVDYCDSNQLAFTTHFSLFNHGGIRASLPSGAITIRSGYEIMPFENELVLLELSGEQVMNLASYIATREGEGVAGITFGMLKDKAVDIKVQGVRVDPAKSYWMVTSDYIANGGDGMKVLTWANKRIDTGYKMREVIIDYMRAMNDRGEKISGSTDGRIYYVE